MTSKESIAYTIHIEGSISEGWMRWFGNMSYAGERAVGSADGTVLQIAVPDQGAMLGALQKLHNLGYTVAEVRMLVTDSESTGRVK